jgi:WD40 repeat protein/serine/threonine protein kinase
LKRITMQRCNISPTPCPDIANLEKLLNDSAAEPLQSQWAAHLETCAHCQQTLQTMVASRDSWFGMARHLVQTEPPAPALLNVITALKDGVSLSGTAADQERPLLDFLDPAEKPDQLGRLAHYEISEVMGRGGMGVVLKAWDSALHRVVAIKVMAPRLAANEKARERFVREARAAAAITHDNVVAVHAVGETHGLPYLVMQHISGMSLAERLEREGALPVPDILQIGMQTAAGLAAAHAQGLIHCDIKPDNLLLEGGSGRVKITDFGLARALDEVGEAEGQAVAGTPRFMAPEQARGEMLDPRTDLFSLGSVLYTLCTGRFPFQGTTNAAVLHQVVTQTPAAIASINPRIPARLVEIIDKLHAKDRTQRFASATEVIHALGGLLARPSDMRTIVPTVEEPRSSRKAPRRRALLSAAATIFVLLLAALTATEMTGLTRLAATVIRIRTPEGVLVVDVDDPQTKVTLDGDTGELVITSPGIHEFRLRPGNYRLRAVRGGETKDEMVTITRDGKQVVAVRFEPRDELIQPKSGASFPIVARLGGHKGPVRTLAIARDGKWLLSCSGWPEGDRSIRLWDLASGKEIRQLMPHDDQVYAVAFSPDGTLAVSGGEDHSVRLWDISTGKQTRSHTDSNRPIFTVAFSPDGKTIVAGSGDGKIRQWSVETGKLLRTFNGHSDGVLSVAFSPDGTQVISGSRDKTVRVWEVESGREIHRFEGHEGWVATVAFSPDGRTIASGSVGIRIWDAASGKLLKELKGHRFGTNSLAFSPDGRWILSGGYDTLVRLWDTATGQLVHNIVDHKDWVWSVAFTPDGKQAVSSGGGGRHNSQYVRGSDFVIRVWKLPDPRPSAGPRQ